MSRLFDASNFGRKLQVVLGDALALPRLAALGGWNDAGAPVLSPQRTDTDKANVYYFHELPNMQPFRGEAHNSGESPIDLSQIKWGDSVFVRRHPVMKVWVLAGTVPILSDENLENLDQNKYPPLPVQLNQIVPGLLDQTDPPSMRVRVMSGPYSVGNQVYVPPTLLSADFSASPLDTEGNAITLPTTPGRAKYVLVQIYPATNTLAYKQGTELPADLSHEIAFAIDGGTGTYFPAKDSEWWRTGFLKLITGQTVIRRVSHIWALHEILTQASAGELLDRILTDDEGAVLVDDEGNVLLEDA